MPDFGDEVADWWMSMSVRHLNEALKHAPGWVSKLGGLVTHKASRKSAVDDPSARCEGMESADGDVVAFSSSSDAFTDFVAATGMDASDAEAVAGAFRRLAGLVAAEGVPASLVWGTAADGEPFVELHARGTEGAVAHALQKALAALTAEMGSDRPVAVCKALEPGLRAAMAVCGVAAPLQPGADGLIHTVIPARVWRGVEQRLELAAPAALGVPGAALAVGVYGTPERLLEALEKAGVPFAVVRDSGFSPDPHTAVFVGEEHRDTLERLARECEAGPVEPVRAARTEPAEREAPGAGGRRAPTAADFADLARKTHEAQRDARADGRATPERGR